ncbi:sugar phosphate isomerase/epimerase family protein [Kineococcus terrestris]|uniref:sugar phosphate isomerase/epimerase family protein n=1 Tax=Kineococcus terrestris TaxID=2044856 RepID=UPI0034DAC16D
MSLERLSLNSATTKRWNLAEVVEGAVKAGLPAVGLWRDVVADAGLENAARTVREAGLRVSTLCRGGFLTAADDAGIAAAREDNRRAVEEAATLGAPALVMVVGGLPAGDRDLAGARERVAERIAELVPVALEHGVRLALEPLHPMYVADRAVLSTLGQALDLAAPHPVEAVGVVVDTFHVFWDPQVHEQIARAGREGRTASYQVCDFNLPIAADALLSRGLMGDGVVDFAALTRSVAAAGWTGDVEVEIFNQDVWDTDGHEVLAAVAERYQRLVLPHLG